MLNPYDSRYDDVGSYRQRRSDLTGPPPPAARPVMGGPPQSFGRGRPAPFGGPPVGTPPVVGGGREHGGGVGSVPGGRGFGGYPPFEPEVGRGFDIGRGGGGRERGFSGGRGAGGRMANGGIVDRRSGSYQGSGGGRGREIGRGGSTGRGFDASRGGGRTGVGGRGFDGNWSGGKNFDGGRAGNRSFDAGRGGVSGFSSGRGGGGRGFNGGRGGGGKGGRHGGSRGDLDNIALPKQDFGNLVPFEKNFYVECPSVRAMTDQDVALYRARREITTEGHDVPKPIRMFQEANFPGIFWDA
ncbi:unnamed protein product [Ilex paraguariensis]|uniref:Uncharacterized protein n=1 Tax=Ilex paraguariensis TaxID=185542 RepID=A0ABC8ST57_9AQUA